MGNSHPHLGLIHYTRRVRHGCITHTSSKPDSPELIVGTHGAICNLSHCQNMLDIQ